MLGNRLLCGLRQEHPELKFPPLGFDCRHGKDFLRHAVPVDTGTQNSKLRILRQQ
jgi:hypothetical protein